MLFLLVGIAASIQQVQTGFLDRNITVGGRAYHYQVYVPADYQTKPSWPAILFLHGAGERGNDGLLQTNVGLGPAIRQNPARYPAIVVFPQVPPDSQWVGTPADMAVAALQQTMREFHVDPSRVYLTGLSMGGHGSTWNARTVCCSAATAMTAGVPTHCESGGTCGKTTIAGYRAGFCRIAGPRPTFVCNRPSLPRSPAPCKNRIAGQLGLV